MLAKGKKSGQVVALLEEPNPGLRRLEASLTHNEEALRQVEGRVDKNHTKVTALRCSCMELQESQLKLQEVFKRKAKLTDKE